jgi:hypothetical protein
MKKFKKQELKKPLIIDFDVINSSNLYEVDLICELFNN